MSSSIVSNWEPRYSKDDSTISDRELTSRTVLDGVISNLLGRPKGDLQTYMPLKDDFVSSGTAGAN